MCLYSKLLGVVYFASFYAVWFLLATLGVKSYIISILIALIFAIVFHRDKFFFNLILTVVFATFDNMITSLINCKYLGSESIIPPGWITGMWLIFISFYTSSPLIKLNLVFTILIFCLGGIASGSYLQSLGSFSCANFYYLGVLWGFYGLALQSLIKFFNVNRLSILRQ